MPLRFEDWSNNLMRQTMRKKYEEKGVKFPEDGRPFLIKIFLEEPFDESAQELKDFMNATQIPENYLDTTRAGRRGGYDPSKIHVDLYGDQLYDQEGKLLWTEERIRAEGHIWKGSSEVWAGGEGSNKKLQ